MSAICFDLSSFQKEPVMGIIRGVAEENLTDVMSTVVSAGLRFVEVTLNTPKALHLIEEASKEFSNQICIGAGTVITRAEAQLAVNAGAQFIVSPTLNVEVAEFCRQQSLAYFPGALTPTEIEKAWNAGATMVKIFPASHMGAEYFRVVKGPFEKIRLMAVGGVGPKNISDYLSSGADAVALGGSILSPTRMRNKEFSFIKKEIEVFLLAVRNFYSNIN
jgi:2-dehydro-3-deoxyphosphogluconate aldolase/(4S)-4-hydroxy-2-oxoglutarate aldolase